MICNVVHVKQMMYNVVHVKQTNLQRIQAMILHSEHLNISGEKMQTIWDGWEVSWDWLNNGYISKFSFDNEFAE